MAAYRTADRLFPGCHKATLFIGMEYLRTNNLKTALMSFKDSLRINDQDPLVFNEIAVVYYKQKNYDAAKEELSRALSLCHDSANNSQTYETILLNLAHCQRKLQEWDDAIETYHRCLQLNPKNP
jgi:anaphase-promoting complex subunit 6